MTMKRIIAGVVGGGSADEATCRTARRLGRLLAESGCVVVCGGLGGVMEAASRGAAEAGGHVIGILPGQDTRDANQWVTHPVATAMGHARNVIIAHTADFLVAVDGGTGTLSEIAIARKLGKEVFSLGSWDDVPGVIVLKDVDDLRNSGVLNG